MANKAYNHNFTMLMEGIQVPFKSAQIVCTPNGVEASINILSNLEALNLKPKTAVQIFYRDWVPVDGKHGHRLMFDGFLSSYVKQDIATEGRGLAITCRDFRMDIRKAPAAMVYQGVQEIHATTLLHMAGIHRTTVSRGFTPTSTKGAPTRVWETSGLQDLGAVIAYIAGTAYGLGTQMLKKKEKKNPKDTTSTEDIQTNASKKTKSKYGEPVYTKAFGTCLVRDLRGKAECGLFLDAVVRGIWSEAVGGTAASTFMNRRIRVDKRFMIPSNKTGFNFWSRQTGGLQAGSTLMGNSRFSSIEAAIMRLAGLFSVRVHSCNTPSLISLETDALHWVMDDRVKKFLVDDNRKEFGGKYILNETMLLPPLEFTSPPNCNLFLPPMYDRVNWQYDIDSDVTRGYFKQIDTLSTKASHDLKGAGIQVPNALFDVYSPGKKSKDKTDNAKRDAHNRVKSPITLEERYKGVSLFYGSVEDLLARTDVSKAFPETMYNDKVVKKIRDKEQELSEKVDKLKGLGVQAEKILKDNLSETEKKLVDTQTLLKKAESLSSRKLNAPGGGYDNTNTQVALKRHSILKFLNAKYAGRVAVIDMAFNPYPMAGFPGAIIVDDEAFGAESSKTVIGMVQQVKHTLVISPTAGEASTTVILNNARFVDEPTDVDEHGNPLYMKATDTQAAEVNQEFDVFENAYWPPDPKAPDVENLDNNYYDLDDSKDVDGYSFVKDVISLSKNDIESGENNGSYLDNDYLPNRIHKFYKEVFGHKEDHFMIGMADDEKDPDKQIKFAYDTMHEAFTRLRTDRSGIFKSYEEALKFVSRDVCSADAFFQGILGLSRRKKVDLGGGLTEEKFVVSEGDFAPEELDEAYFGISDDMWNNDERVKGLKSSDVEPGQNGKMTWPGQFSSIKEHLPLTAFIQERRDAVQIYLDKVNKRVEGVQFVNTNG